MSESERAEALAFLKSPTLLDQVARDVDALGYVGEETNKRLPYLVALSRKLSDPVSAVILSRSGAGTSGLTEVIERLTPPEDVVLLTRLTPHSLSYVVVDVLDQTLVIIEARYGSMEAEESSRLMEAPSASSWRGKRDPAILELLYGAGIRRASASGSTSTTSISCRDGFSFGTPKERETVSFPWRASPPPPSISTFGKFALSFSTIPAREPSSLADIGNERADSPR